MNPGIASFPDIAHDFDLKSAVLAARDKRGRTRASQGPRLPQPVRPPGARPIAAGQPGVVRSGMVEREATPPIADGITALMRKVSTVGKLVE